MTDIRDDVAEAFTETYGSAPLGLWSAPGRVRLLGGDELALSVAINRRTIVALGVRDDGVLRVASALADEVAEIALAELSDDVLDGWAAYPLGVALALGQLGADLAAVPGADLYVESTVPVGAGLGSSTALTVAVAIALNDAWQLGFDRATLARAAQLAEHATSTADASATLFGTSDHAVLSTAPAELIPLGFDAAGLELLLIDTGLELVGPSGSEHAAAPSPEAGDHAASAQLVRDATRALRTGDHAAFGDLLDAAAGGVPELDLALETARANGALGARVLSGGSAVALVAGDAVSRIQVALDGAFAEHGLGQPTAYTVTASGGAARD